MREARPAENLETLEQTGSPTGLTQQGTQKFGGVRIGNGPTEDEAEIIDHDQLSQHSEEGDEVGGVYDVSQWYMTHGIIWIGNTTFIIVFFPDIYWCIFLIHNT